MSGTKHCPDCSVAPGSPHDPGCDVERCPLCGGQAIQCDHEHDFEGAAPIPWTGLWPGTLECREFGWTLPMVDQCDGGAFPDLNRLATHGRWDPAARRWVRR